jgi:hypothetical protein
MTKTLVASTSTVQQTLPTTLMITASNGQITTVSTNVVTAQTTILLSTIGSGHGPTITVSGGGGSATTVVTVGGGTPTRTVVGPSLSGSYIATTEQITSTSYGVTSTTITTTDSAGRAVISTSYGIQGYTFTSLRITSVLAYPYGNGGGPPVTVSLPSNASKRPYCAIHRSCLVDYEHGSATDTFCINRSQSPLPDKRQLQRVKQSL